MNANVSSITGQISSIANFYCNKRLNILLRIKSFARRVRFRCKLHNQILYPNIIKGNNLINKEFNEKKLNKDPLDYQKISEFMVEDLVTKCSFLSNHDLILILDLLTRIKKPLKEICHYKAENNYHPDSDHGQLEHVSKNHLINNIIFKGQKSLLKYIIQSEENKTLTDNERYYLIIALSRECRLIPFSIWLKLFENVNHSLITKQPDSLYGHKPFQIANLLLIYDQISRYTHKKQCSLFKIVKYSSNEGIEIGVNTGQLKPIETGLQVGNIERRRSNPFKLDLINTSIYRLESCLSELKPEKLIKILYLINSRQSYANNFFQNTLIHLESGNLIGSLKTSQVYTLFTLFSTNYKFQFMSLLESLNYEFQFLKAKLSISPSLCSEISLSNLITDNINGKCTLKIKDNMNKMSENNEFKESINKYKRLESICLCVMILTLEYITRLKGLVFNLPPNSMNLTFGIQHIFGEGHEWNDLLLLLDTKIRNPKRSFTQSEITKGMTREFSGKLENLMEYNKILVKILKINPKYENYTQRVQFFVDFFFIYKTAHF
ncbi:uncharacterized protein TA18900 [Theileria annulata]|uniref:Uncharacterized protein n=1 Tax=Theileria annulata TaxID=5874 RepID=Q4UG62_THEAN|nr:uncharacterized protein TA18900 [Theileria annulata]CAI73927.1 hypothetical protein TA18900 [Theileria annulata]|eukprot:XP_954604.1 hypothetical protein TA18900 [Theileria annulata]